MADASDVCNTIVGIITGILYPTGTSNPSIAGIAIKVFQGWPVQDQLDADLAAGNAQVSVYPLATERNTTRYLEQWVQSTVNTPTLTLTKSGQTVTIGGTIPTPQNPTNVVIFANGLPYVYAVQPTDTLNSIAAALAALIVAGVAGTTSSGAIVTLPNSARLGAVRVGVTGTSAMEIRRTEKQFQISVWVNSPTTRDAIVQPVDAGLTALTFLTLPDGGSGRIRYVATRIYDQFQKTRLFRRDLIYTVEYATLDTETDTQITQIGLNVTAAIAGVEPEVTVVNSYS